MLSVQRCRAILGKAAQGKSDAEIERLRDDLHALAAVTVDMFLDRSGADPQNAAGGMPKGLDTVAAVR